MAVRWFAILVLLLAVVFGYLATLNSVKLDIVLPFIGQYTIASGLLMILSFSFGVLFAIIFFAIRDWKQFFRREARKKKEKLARISRMKMARSKGYIELGMLEQASVNLKEAIDKNPELAEAHNLMGDLAAGKGDHHGAASNHSQAIKLDPADHTLKWKLAVDYMKGGDGPLAAMVLREALDDNDKNPYLLVKYRELLMELGDWDGAISIHNRLAKVKEFKNHEDHRNILAGLHFEKGSALMDEGKNEEAARALEEANKYDQQLSSAYVKTGEAYIAMGRHKAALKVWALGYRRTSDQAILSKLEDYYLKHNDPSRIINLYLRHIEEKPEDALLRFQFASLLFKLEMLQETRNQIEEVRKLQVEDSPQVAYLAYRLKEKMGDTEGALNELTFLAKNFHLKDNKYVCSACRRSLPEQLDRCPGCRRWGSIRKRI